MAKARDPTGGEALLIGIEAFIPPPAPISAGHSIVDVGYGRVEAGGWYLVRRSNGHYDPPCCTDRADWRRELGGVGRRILP